MSVLTKTTARSSVEAFFSTPEDDATLMVSLRAREESARDAIFSRYYPMVRGLLRRGLGPDADIDDLVQDAFLQFFRGVERVRDAKALRMYMVSVTTNVLRNEFRRRRRRPSLAFSGARTLEIVGSSADFEARAAVRALYAALDRLDPVERAAYLLRHVEHLQLDAIARLLDVSLSTLKRRLTAAAARVDALVRADPALADYFNCEEGWADDGET